MKWIKYGLMLLAVAAAVLVVLANRDITRIYGGLTDRVDRSSFAPYSGPLAITNVNVLASDAERFLPGQTVLINEGTIISINHQGAPDASYRVIDGSDKYLVPGFTDSHVHLFKSPNDLLLYAANGVTQVRELIGEEDHLKWRTQTRAGALGPEMFIASPRIGSFDGVEGFFMEWSQGFLSISTAEDAVKEVRRLNALGYDAVKIYSQINQEAYWAVVREAKALDMRVVGHVPWSLGLDDIYMEQESVAHLEELMNALNREFGGFKAATSREFLAFVEARSDEVASRLSSNDIAVSTTLWLVESFVRQKFALEDVLKEVELDYQNPGISEWTPNVPEGGLGWLPGVNRYQSQGQATAEQLRMRRVYWETYASACRTVLRSLVANNVQIMTGTDANLPPTVPGFSLHDEFESLVAAGMTPAQVLRAATSAPAEWLNNNAGQVAPGKKAQLVLLNANPLVDIRNTRTIDAVVINNTLLDRGLLDNLLNAVRTANDSSRTQNIDRYR